MVDRVVAVYDRARKQQPPAGLARLRQLASDFDWDHFGQSIREKLGGAHRPTDEHESELI